MTFLINNTINFKPKSAVKFGLISDNNEDKAESYSYKPIYIEENEQEVKIEASIDGEEQTLKYEKDDMGYFQQLLVGLTFLILREPSTKEDNKDRASFYIEKCIKSENGLFIISDEPKKSWLPYYLAGRYNLNINTTNLNYHLREIQEQKNGLPEAFFAFMIQEERHPARRGKTIELALKNHPKNEFFINKKAEQLSKNSSEERGVKYILEKRSEIKEEKWNKMIHLRTFLIKLCLQSENYDKVLKETKAPLLALTDYGSNLSPLFKGIVYYQKNELGKAVSFLNKAIVEDRHNRDITTFANYFLIASYAKNNDTSNLQKVLETFTPQPEIMILSFTFDYKNFVINELEEAVEAQNKNGIITAKLQGLLAYILEKSVRRTEGKGRQQRALTSGEKKRLNRAVSEAKKAIQYFPQKRIYHVVCSNAHRKLNNAPEAMDYRLSAIATEDNRSKDPPEVKVSDCSNSYLREYPAKLKMTFKESDVGFKNYLDKNRFNDDINGLWNKGLHNVITQLYEVIQPHIKSLSAIDEDSTFRNGGIFEVAYSLNATGQPVEAKRLYEYLEAENKSSAVLNNLGVIHEKEGNINKARAYFKKAKESDGNNQKAQKNYRRLMEEGPETEPEAQKEEIGRIIYKPASNEIKFGSKTCSIPPASNQRVLCEAVFTPPLDNWVEEVDVEHDFYKQSDSSFYNAQRLLNEKIKKKIGVSNFIEYSTSKARINKGYRNLVQSESES